MFSKSRSSDPVPQPAETPAAGVSASAEPRPGYVAASPVAKSKPAPSILSSDIVVTGDIRSTGDIQIEGSVEGDVRSQVVIVGETATIRGEVVAEELVVHGRVIGRLRGVKIRLTATARVEGDIVHKTIAIENGAHFEGSVQRQDDPTAQGAPAPARIPGPSRVAPPPAPPQIEAAS